VETHRVSTELREACAARDAEVEVVARWLGRVTYEANHMPLPPLRDSEASRHLANVGGKRRSREPQPLTQATAPTGPRFAGHKPVPHDKRWMCITCRRISTMPKLIATPCKGPPTTRWALSARSKARAAAARRRAAHAPDDAMRDLASMVPLPGPIAPPDTVSAHSMCTTGPVFWCNSCGGYAVSHAVLLARPCPGPVKRWRGGGRHQNLLALRAGKHPVSGAWLVPPIVPPALEVLPEDTSLPPPPPYGPNRPNPPATSSPARSRSPPPSRRRGAMQLGGDGNNHVLRTARVVRQPGDGNCLFHSLAYGLDDPATNAHVLRRDLAAFLLENPSLRIAGGSLEDWVRWDTRSSLVAYARRIAISGWGGGIELATCSLLKNVNIHVYQSDARPLGRGTGKFKRISCFDSPNATKTVNVLYQGGTHYDALVLTAARPARLAASATATTPTAAAHGSASRTKRPHDVPLLSARVEAVRRRVINKQLASAASSGAASDNGVAKAEAQHLDGVTGALDAPSDEPMPGETPWKPSISRADENDKALSTSLSETLGAGADLGAAVPANLANSS
jgi:hypothetical protein